MIKLSITLPSGVQVAIEADDKEFVREVLYFAMPDLNRAPPYAGVETNGLAPEPFGPDPFAHANGSYSGNGSHGNGAHGNGLALEPGAQANGAHSPGPPPEPATYSNGPQANGVHTNGPHTNDPHTNGHGDAIVSSQPPPANGSDPGYAAASGPAIANGNHRPAIADFAPPASPPPAQAQQLTYTPSTPDEHEFIAFCQRVSPLGDMRRVVVAAEAAARHLAVPSVDPDELERLFTLAGWPLPHSFVQTLRNAARTKFRWLERIPGKPGHYRVTDTGRSIVLGDNSPPRRNQPGETDGSPAG